ncbi:MAG: autotransporter outer membrane beta-barrel domain-containing protein [Alphaproteobacteria bacterium]
MPPLPNQPPFIPGDAPSTDTSTEILRATTSVLANVISSRVSAAVGGPPGGGRARAQRPQYATLGPYVTPGLEQTAQAAAPDGGGSFAAWLTGGWTRVEDSYVATAFKGDIWTPVAGADYTVDGRWVFGVTAGYEGSRIDTNYVHVPGRFKGDGFSIAPYVGLRLTDELLVTGGVGYVRTSYEQGRREAARSLRGSFDGDRVFGFVNLAATAPVAWHGVDGLSLSASLGYRHVKEWQGSYTETGTDGSADRKTSAEVELGQIVVGPRIAYAISDGMGGMVVEPFVSALFEYDAVSEASRPTPGSRSTGTDRTGFLIATGINLQMDDGLSGSLEFNSMVGRENFESYSLILGLRYRF